MSTEREKLVEEYTDFLVGPKANSPSVFTDSHYDAVYHRAWSRAIAVRLSTERLRRKLVAIAKGTWRPS
jgi:hypothetical protein